MMRVGSWGRPKYSAASAVMHEAATHRPASMARRRTVGYVGFVPVSVAGGDVGDAVVGLPEIVQDDPFTVGHERDLDGLPGLDDYGVVMLVCRGRGL
jgi:hypothetical protein